MHRLFKYNFITLLAIALFSGCAQGKKSELSQGVAIDETIERAIDGMTFEEGPWPSRQWWEVFKDDQLSALIEKGLNSNRSIKEAKAKVFFAEASAKKIRSALLPTLGADYGESWTYFSKNGFVRSFYPIGNSITVPSKMNLVDLSLSFFYEFDFFGKNRKMFKAALGEARASRAESIQVELTISTLIAFAYFEWQTHMSELKIFEAMRDSWQEGLELIEEQNSSGITSNIKVIDVTNELFGVERKISDIKKQAHIDQYVLKCLTGEGPDSKQELTFKPITSSEKIALPSFVAADLLSRRADLTAMIWHVESAAKEIGVARAEFYPNVNLSALSGVESLQFPSLFSWASRTGSLVPAIHLPLFTGGKLSANLSSKVAKFNETTERYNGLLLEAAKEVATEIVTLKSLYEQASLQEEITMRAEEKENLFLNRFESGVDNFLSYLLSHQQTLKQMHEAALIENYLALSHVRLIKSLGGGFTAEKLPSLAHKE